MAPGQLATPVSRERVWTSVLQCSIVRLAELLATKKKVGSEKHLLSAVKNFGTCHTLVRDAVDQTVPLSMGRVELFGLQRIRRELRCSLSLCLLWCDVSNAHPQIPGLDRMGCGSAKN